MCGMTPWPAPAFRRAGQGARDQISTLAWKASDPEFGHTTKRDAGQLETAAPI
jgi:hypothetical protein